MYVNNKWVSGGNDWSKPQTVALRSALKKGDNTIVVIVKNEAEVPNAAGLFFQAQLNLEGQSELVVQSDETWEFNPNAPKRVANKLARIRGSWQNATMVPTLPVWAKVVNDQCRPILAEVSAMVDDMPMVRASLMKNTALMKSLGRPMREQIVSMRPDRVTTLEAIDLANESTLAGAFAKGAERLIEQNDGDADRIMSRCSDAP